MSPRLPDLVGPRRIAMKIDNELFNNVLEGIIPLSSDDVLKYFQMIHSERDSLDQSARRMQLRLLATLRQQGLIVYHTTKAVGRLLEMSREDDYVD